MENMKERVSAVLVQVNKKAELHLDSTSLVSSGILDSLDIMSLIMDLEREFEIEIDPEDVLSENFESVSARFFTSHLTERRSPWMYMVTG